MEALRQPVIGPDPYTPEWYELRLFDPDREDRPVVFGASDAAACCNVCPYEHSRTALDVYLDKREAPDAEERAAENEAVRWGKRFEAPILDEYEEQTGLTIERTVAMHLSEVHMFMGATPDALAWESLDDAPRSVDAKCSNWRMFDRTGEDEHKFGEEGTDEVPMTILLQAQQQMEVLGLFRCDIPVLKNGNEFKIYSVERNDAIIEQIVDAERQLAEMIITGKPPKPVWAHEGTRAALHKLYGVSVGTCITLSRDWLQKWNTICRLKAEIKDGKSLVEELTNQFYFEMADHENARFVGNGEIELHRSIVRPTIVTREAIDKLSARIGQVARKGHQRLGQRKIK